MKLHIRIFEKKILVGRWLVIQWALCALPWLFSHIFPRKKNCWIFELIDGRLSQIYPLFIYASKHTSMECVGICDNKKLVKEFSKKWLKVYYKV